MAVQLSLNNVSFGYLPGLPVLTDLSLVLGGGRAGEIIAIMGPSGVGKSTLFGLLLRTLAPHSGDISISPRDANIVVIPQKPVLFNELSADENIRCLRHSRAVGRTFSDARVADAVDRLNLNEVVERNTEMMSLSGGEAQRIMLARAMTVKCDMLLLDEPCSFLDNSLKSGFLRHVRQFTDSSNVLTLMITHNWDEAVTISDRVCYLWRQKLTGRVVLRIGTPAEYAEVPPNIDAMFAIHWPRCSWAELKNGLLDGFADSISVPSNAVSIGIIAGPPTRRSRPVDPRLWSRAGGADTLRGHSDDGELTTAEYRCVFFDENGEHARE